MYILSPFLILMSSFYNSTSFILNSKDFNNVLIAESQARIFDFNYSRHATHTNGFFYPDSIDKILTFLNQNDINTAYFSLHPMCSFNLKNKRNIIKTKKKLYWVDLEKKIDIKNFSKSIKDKVKKYSKLQFEECSKQEFTKTYKKQSYFNSNLNLNLEYENIKSYKLTDNLRTTYAVIGVGKNIIEYLLACSNENSLDLQGVLIYQLLMFFQNKAEKFNLGGGILPGDGVEKFKSFFNSNVKQQEVMKIIIDKKKFNRFENINKEINFFPSYASIDMLKKYFNYE